MSSLRLVFAEIAYRWINVALSLVAVATAAALFMAGPTLLSGYSQETSDRLGKLQHATDVELAGMKMESDKQLAEMDKQTKRIMRDLGVNLRIVHKDTNFGGLYTDFKAEDFDEEYVNRLATSESIETIVHLLATLQHKSEWNDRTVLIVGVLPVVTVSQKNEEKPHMVKSIDRGTVLVGSELAGGEQPLKAGDEIDILGKKFKVAQVQSPFGGLEDVQLMMHLHDAQEILEKQGKINQILALNCKCKGDRISVVRRELEGVLPDTKVTEHTTRATAREKQRDLVATKAKDQREMLAANSKSQLDRLRQNRREVENTLGVLVGFAIPLVVLVSGAFIGLLTWLNVRERRPEIGLLRALGKSGLRIAALFLTKAALIGFLGGALGAAIGWTAAFLVGANWLEIASSHLAPNTLLLAGTLIGAPLIAALAAYLPTLSAVTQDPAVVLNDV